MENPSQVTLEPFLTRLIRILETPVLNHFVVGLGIVRPIQHNLALVLTLLLVMSIPSRLPPNTILVNLAVDKVDRAMSIFLI